MKKKENVVSSCRRFEESTSPRKSLKRRRSRQKQLIEFERGRVIGKRENVFFPDDIAERLGRNVPLCMLVGSNGQGMALPKEDQVPGGHIALLRGKIAVSGVLLRRIESAAEIRAAVGTTVTQQTVRNRLRQGQLKANQPVACIQATTSTTSMELHTTRVWYLYDKRHARLQACIKIL
ncbi:uncharacterized protein TNCV_4198701 [Trichonephila clavipes]|nr:uncharacterized protein TNCV_4198701 [Trichonephila clavipes]